MIIHKQNKLRQIVIEDIRYKEIEEFLTSYTSIPLYLYYFIPCPVVFSRSKIS